MESKAELTQLGQVLFDAGAKAERSRIRKLVEEKKVRRWEIDPPSGIGYNRACDDILKLLNN